MLVESADAAATGIGAVCVASLHSSVLFLVNSVSAFALVLTLTIAVLVLRFRTSTDFFANLSSARPSACASATCALR